MKAGWDTKTLGEVCVVDKYQGIHKGLPYVGLENIESQTGRFVGATEPLTVKSSTFKFSPDHLLYGRLRPYLNKVMLPDFTGHCSTEIFPIKPRAGLSREFLQYWFFLDATVEKIDATSTGARMPRANMRAVLDFDFPLPPLPEQQRIVGILDEAFEGIATAKANAEQNLQNARAIFQSYLQSVFTQSHSGWPEQRLGDVAEVQSGGTPLVSQKKYWGGTIPWYSSGELNAILTSEPERYITKAGLDGSNAKLFPKGSLLVGMYDTAALKMSILDRDGAFNQAIAGVKPSEKIETEFILHAINADKPKLLRERRGVRQKNLSLGKIKDIRVPLPDRDDQRAAVSSLQKFYAETERLASFYERKSDCLDEMKKSLLYQAFTGNL